MKVENLTLTDIHQICALHQETLDSPGSKIGLAYLIQFYKLLLAHPQLHINLKIIHQDKILAVVTCTRDLKRTNMILKDLFNFSVLVAILKALILGKVIPKELISRFIFEQKVIKKFPSPYATILTLFVAKKYQRHGIGKKLVKELIKRLKQDRVKTIHVDTYIKNEQALVFYQSIGFQIVEQITDSVVLERRL